uniref:Ig-like domain-containing protein n=1 Tax=Anopheles funestus TaxID=62324 RepID=A0A4Y0BNB0_ANOFN
MDSRKATAQRSTGRFLLIRVGSIFLIGIIIFVPVIAALRDVQVQVPPAVRRGDTATLHCYYDMDGESLYSVKWYKGRREFYRYTPKESPPMKIFPAQGVQVKRSASNESQLTLLGLSLSSSGKYSCEVSADAPSFHTMIVTGDLEVCEVPKHVPSIHGMRSRYRVGDIVRGNCTSHNSRPPANLTWYINEAQANPSYIRTHKPFRERKNEFETSLAGIHFVVGSHHFVNGKLKVCRIIRCTARIHDIYLQSTERSIDEDRPRVISAASSANSNGNGANGNAVPYDHFPPYAENELDRKDYMTHLQGDMASSGSAPAARPILPSVSFNSVDHFRLTSINQLSWTVGPLTVLLLPLAHPLLCSLINRLSATLRA